MVSVSLSLRNFFKELYLGAQVELVGETVMGQERTRPWLPWNRFWVETPAGWRENPRIVKKCHFGTHCFSDTHES